MNRKLGKMYITKELMEDPNFATILSDLSFIPYRVEYLYYKSCFEYIGTSTHFREVVEGEAPPEYKITFHQEWNGTHTSVEEIK